MNIFSKNKSYYKLSRSIIMMILLCFCIFLNENIFAQGTFVLRGRLIDKENNSVLSLVNVKLSKENSDDFLQTRTDNSGNYEFINIQNGDYKITAGYVGYNEFRSIINIGTFEIKIYNIFLEQSDIETEKINVTATKTEITLQQTPSSISIINSDEISNKNILTFDNVLEEVNGITVNRSNGINVNSLSIRGSSDVAGGGIGNRVLLLLDGRPSLTGDSKGALWSLIPVSLIERTEIVKGAFSSLYGSSAIGGVINVITKKPSYKPSTSVNLNYGFYEKLNDSLRFTNRLLSFSGGDILHSNTIKKFSYLLNLNYLNNEGHAQQTNYDFYSVTGKFTYDVLSNRDLEATIQYTNSHSGFPHYWRKEGGSVAEPFKVANVYIGDKIQKQTQSYDLFYRAIPNSSSKYTSRFYYYNLKSNSFYNPNNPVSLQFADTGSGLNTYINSYNAGNITQIDFKLGRNNYLIAGFDFQMNIVRSYPSVILYGNQQMNNTGIFLQEQMNILNDKNGKTILSSTAGLRLDYNKIVSGVRSVQLSPKLSFVFTPVTLNKIFTNTSLRILGGRAFRAPSIAEIYFKKELFGGFEFIYNPDLRPEEMLSFEIGIKKQYKNRFTADVSFFFNDYNNLIQYVNTGSSLYGPFQVRNVARAQIKGFEFYMDYSSKFKLLSSPVDYYFNIGYTYLDAKDLSENRPDEFLPYKPRHNFNFAVNFKYSGFNINFNGRYLSKIDEVIFYKY
ncbi:MAG: TonB-dependent receptor, partial [Ignavibacteria bacterium]